MNFEFKNLSNKKMSILFYVFLTINGLILISKLFFGTLNDQTDFLFGISYFLLFII
ncbi:MAG: hypothetical protein CI947_1826, partial [Halanaerobium sp.]